MKRVFASLLIAAMVTTQIVGISVPTFAEEISQTEHAQDVSDQNVELKDSVIKAYKKVLKSPAKYIKDTMAVKKRKFTYALIDMDKSGIPCLVIETGGLDEAGYSTINDIDIFKYSKTKNKAVHIKGRLNEGMGSAGGYRGGADKVKNGVGISVTEYNAGNGDFTVTVSTVKGSKLVSKVVARGSLADDDVAGGPETEKIKWHKVKSLNTLNNINIKD